MTEIQTETETFGRSFPSVTIHNKSEQTGATALMEVTDLSNLFISVTEFSDKARITRQAVVKMINENRVRFGKIGEQYAIPKSELERYLQER